MKVLIVLTCEIREPEDVPDILDHINPPHVPFFAGQVRIVVEPYVDEVLELLDEE